MTRTHLRPLTAALIAGLALVPAVGRAAPEPAVLAISVHGPHPTEAFVTWPQVAGAATYRLRYREQSEPPGLRWKDLPLTETFAMLRGLKPAAEYELTVEALPERTAGRAPVALARGHTNFHSPSGEPTTWEELRVRPPQAMVTSLAGTSPALGVLDAKLYLLEIADGGVSLAEVDAEGKLGATMTPLAPGVGGVERISLCAAPLRDRLWIAWIERRAEGSFLMLTSWAPDKPETVPPRELARAQWCSLAPQGDRLWVGWSPLPATEGPRTPLVVAPFAPETGLGEAQTWDPPPGPPLQPCLAAFQAEVALVFAVAKPPGRPLWAATFSGSAFSGTRLLRGLGSCQAPRAAAMNYSLYVVYNSDASYPPQPESASDIVVAQMGGDVMAVTSITVDSDGAYNCLPSAAVVGDTLWIAYSKWSRDPALGPGATSYGTYLARLALPPLVQPPPTPAAPSRKAKKPKG
jgi:hypothetical protein